MAFKETFPDDMLDETSQLLSNPSAYVASLHGNYEKSSCIKTACSCTVTTKLVDAHIVPAVTVTLQTVRGTHVAEKAANALQCFSASNVNLVVLGASRGPSQVFDGFEHVFDLF